MHNDVGVRIMRISNSILLCGGLVACASGAWAQTASDVLQEMADRTRASLAGIDSYSIMKTTMGQCTLEHYERASTPALDGNGTVSYLRLVPVSEVLDRENPDSPFAQASPADLEHAANVLRQQGDRVDSEVRSKISGAGLPGGLGYLLMNPPPDEPWLSPMPGDMMDNYAMFLEGAAEAKVKEQERQAVEAIDAKSDPLAAVAELATIAGRETMNNRPAFHIVADDLNYSQVENGQEFTLDTLHLWVDAEHYVPLKMQFDGTADEGGKKRELRIEREDGGYGTVDSCGAMYAPIRTVMRISGVMNAKEQAEMEEAQEKLAEFKAQLASMPQAQQDMIKRQMGSQLEMFEKMAAGQGIEVVSLVVGRRCNAGAPSQEEYLQTAPGVSQGACIGFVND